VAQALVVLNCAGPFIQHGPPLVEACLAEGTHYVDITGNAYATSTVTRH